MRPGLLQHLILFPVLPALAPRGGGEGRRWLRALSIEMVLPISWAGAGRIPDTLWGIRSHSCHQAKVSQMLEQL